MVENLMCPGSRLVSGLWTAVVSDEGFVEHWWVVLVASPILELIPEGFAIVYSPTRQSVAVRQRQHATRYERAHDEHLY